MKNAVVLLACIYSLPGFCQSPTFSWAKDFGGPEADKSHSLEIGPDNFVYMTGSFNGSVDFNPGAGVDMHTSQGGQDIFVSKFDQGGNHIWTNTFGSANVWEQGASIAIDSDTNVYFTGIFASTVDFDPGPGVTNLVSPSFETTFICKLDQDGGLIWVKQISGTSVNECNHLRLDDSGNIYCSGTFQNTADFNPGSGTFNLTSIASSDLFLLKLDSDGNFLWVDQFGGPNSQSDRQLFVSGSGEITLSGCFSNSIDIDPGTGVTSYTQMGASVDGFIAVLDSDGNLSWSHHYWGDDGFQGVSLTRDENNNILLGGFWSGTADFDAGPGIFNLTASGFQDAFILKVDENGNFINAASYGGFTMPYTDDVETYQNMIYLVGFFSISADFDPGPGVYELNTSSDFERYLLMLDSDLNFKYAFAFGGSDNGQPSGDLVMDNDGNFYMTAYFQYTNDLDPTAGVFNASSSGSHDVYLIKMVSCVETIVNQSADDLTLTAPLGLETYQWYDCDKGDIILGETNDTFTVTENGSYAVIINNGFCSDTSVCTAVNSMGTSREESLYFNAYPNPVHDQLFIECPQGALVTIYDAMGQIVFSEKMQTPKSIISFKDMASGLYTCQFQLDERAGIFTKIIKVAQ